MSDDYEIEIAPGHIYWAPIPPSRTRSRWERVRSWWWRKRGHQKWVDLGYTTSEDDL